MLFLTGKEGSPGVFPEGVAFGATQGACIHEIWRHGVVGVVTKLNGHTSHQHSGNTVCGLFFT